MRAFIAIALPAHVRDALCRLQDSWREKGLRATWVKRDALHLTLRFLDDVAEETIPLIQGVLDEQCASLGAPLMSVRGIGAFPSLSRPAVVWAGLETVEGDLCRLFRAAEDAACAAGLPSESRPVHGHITLARVREPRFARGFAETLSRYGAARSSITFGEEFRPSGVILYRSVLTPRGPLYSVVWESKLL